MKSNECSWNCSGIPKQFEERPFPVKKTQTKHRQIRNAPSEGEGFEKCLQLESCSWRRWLRGVRGCKATTGPGARNPPRLCRCGAAPPQTQHPAAAPRPRLRSQPESREGRIFADACVRVPSILPAATARRYPREFPAARWGVHLGRPGEEPASLSSPRSLRRSETLSDLRSAERDADVRPAPGPDGSAPPFPPADPDVLSGRLKLRDRSPACGRAGAGARGRAGARVLPPDGSLPDALGLLSCRSHSKSHPFPVPFWSHTFPFHLSS